MEIQIGQKFGKLTVVEEAEPKARGNTNRKRRRWLCKCECGNEVVIYDDYLKNGHSKSCGCAKSTNMIGNKHAQKHGQYGTRLYNIWHTMMSRCTNPKDISYKWYGGKGIKLCDEWEQFEPFGVWALSNGYANNLTIDRINPDEDYCPSNCRWADWKTQQNHRGNNHFITYNNETHTLTEWADILGIPQKTLFARINDKKWDIERAFTQPVRKRK